MSLTTESRARGPVGFDREYTMVEGRSPIVLTELTRSLVPYGHSLSAQPAWIPEVTEFEHFISVSPRIPLALSFGYSSIYLENVIPYEFISVSPRIPLALSFGYSSIYLENVIPYEFISVSPRIPLALSFGYSSIYLENVIPYEEE
ncbi:hypothetical protein SprV_0602181500 [Sparganum proliferum]